MQPRETINELNSNVFSPFLLLLQCCCSCFENVSYFEYVVLFLPKFMINVTILILAPLDWFELSGEIFCWPFQGGTSFVDLLCLCTCLFL